MTLKDHADQNGLLTVIAGVILMLVLGSIHAFSVFLEPLETRFDATRGEVSVTYSLALVCLTLSVLFGHIVFARVRPATLALCICICAGLGCLLAAFAGSLPVVWLTYSVLFGTANGLGYALVLQASAQANPERKGLAIGTITACYALGAAVSPFFFDLLMRRWGFPGAMFGLSAVLLAIAPVVCGLLLKAHTRLDVVGINKSNPAGGPVAPVLKMWIGYGTAVFAGLMAIGHASGIVRVVSESNFLVLLAPVLVAILNMLGSLVAGVLADRLPVKQLLMALPVLSLVSLLALAIGGSTYLMLGGLALIGFAYGAIISVYPVAVSEVFGPVAGVRVYGRVFTAWGIAGIAGPVSAGMLYSGFGNYQLAMILAAVLCLVSVFVISRL